MCMSLKGGLCLCCVYINAMLPTSNSDGYICPLVSYPLNEPFHSRSATNTENMNKENHFDVSKDKSKAFIIIPVLCDFTKRHLLLVPRLLCHEQSH